MRPSIFLAVLFAMTAWRLTAQAPGYLGKRLYVKPGSSVMFALKYPTASNKGGGDHFGAGSGTLGFNTRPGVQIGYALTRRNVLAFEAGYIKTGMILSAYTPSLQYEGYSDSHYLFYHLSGIEYDLSWQIYNPLKGSLAPMGFFTAWHLKAAPVKGEIVDKQTSYGNTDIATKHAPLGINARYTHWSVGLEVGQHIILFDRLILALSAELNVPPMRLILEQTGKYYDEGTNQQRFNQAAFDRMQGHSIFMIKLGAGYLL